MAEVAEYPGDVEDLEALVRVVQMVVGWANGEVGDDESAAFPFKPRYDGAGYSIDQSRATAGPTARMLAGGVNHLTLQPSGGTSDLAWTLASLIVSGALSAGATTLTSLTVTPGATSLGVLGAGATTVTALTNTGATTLGNEDTDLTIISSLLRVQNAAGSLIPLFVDGPNNRVQMGSLTALTSAADSKLEVIGGSVHIATDATGGGEEIAQGWRYGAAGSSWTLWLSAAANPDLALRNDANAQVLRLTDAGLLIVGTALAAVSGAGAGDVQADDVWVVDGANYRGLIANGSAFQITGNANSGTDLTIDSAGMVTIKGLTVDTNGADITGPLTVTATDPPTADGVVTAGSLCKAFAYVTAGGGASLGQNYNVASVTRNGTGDFTVAWDRDFSAATYAVLVTIQDNGANLLWRVNGQAGGSADIHFRDTAGAPAEPDAFAVACFGVLS